MQYYSLFNEFMFMLKFKQEVLHMLNKSENKHYDKYRRMGLNIALKRKLKKMTQSDLDEAINISRLKKIIQIKANVYKNFLK